LVGKITNVGFKEQKNVCYGKKHWSRKTSILN
jgi:hypothetical protein